MEASALQAPAGLVRTRISIGVPLLRVRSDEQLVALFRAGNEEAFRVIHDRYRQRLLAYTRQMLRGSEHDAEDALQDVLMRAYGGLRANGRELALRAWLYRVAHNRCLDQLRRPAGAPAAAMDLMRSQIHDPVAETEQRESLQRLLADVRRLPEQQRSALLMRELGGMAYVDVAGALGVSVAAVKSLLVRARVGLVQAGQARDTACPEIRGELILAHDRGMRPSSLARRHLRDCEGCREFRTEVRGVTRQLAALVPALGPIGVLAKVLGLGGGAGGAMGAAGGTAGTAGVATSAGVTASAGLAASAGAIATGAGHVATLLAAAVIAVGGAAEVQHATSSSAHQTRHKSSAAVVSAAAMQRPSAPMPGPAAVYQSSTDASAPSVGGARAVPRLAAHPGSKAPWPAPTSSGAPGGNGGVQGIGGSAATGIGPAGPTTTNGPVGPGAAAPGVTPGSGVGLGAGALLPTDGSVTGTSAGASACPPTGSNPGSSAGSSACPPTGSDVGPPTGSGPEATGGGPPTPTAAGSADTTGPGPSVASGSPGLPATSGTSPAGH